MSAHRLVTRLLPVSALALACGNAVAPSEPPDPVAAVVVTTPAEIIEIARPVQLGVVVRNATGAALSGRRVDWSVSDTSRATIDAGGRVTGVAPGPVTVAAASEGVADTVALHVLVAFETGGSNYPMYSVGAYLGSPNDDTWYTPLELRPVVATYHLDSTTVRQQLDAMYANGQRRISLVLWFTDADSDDRLLEWPERSYGHILVTEDGRLHPRHEANLRALLDHIRAAGFREVEIRWAPQAYSDPVGWSSWREDMYSRTRTLFSSVHDLVTEAAAGSIAVVYDLGVEMGGIDGGQRRPYRLRLWKDWVASFGADGTVAFSFIPGSGRLARELSLYDQVGARPSSFAFDVYDNALANLTALRTELEAAGESARPLTIQEAWYNDAATANAIRRARDELKLNIRTIFQWPLSRGATQRHFSVHFPAAFEAYLSPAGG